MPENLTRSHPLTAVLFVFFMLLSSGCSSSDSTPEPEAVELKPTTQASVDSPEAELFYASKRLYASGLYSVAIENFQALRDGYPLGPYAEFAEIKIADARFEMREYDTAAQLYEEFLKSHPASQALAYVTMRAGRSHQMAHRGVGRDTTSLEKAVEWYDRVIAAYPDSVYAGNAKGFRAEALAILADSDREILEFYRRREKPDAAAAREHFIAERWYPLLTKTKRDLENNPAQTSQGSSATAAREQHSPQAAPPIVRMADRYGAVAQSKKSPSALASTDIPAPVERVSSPNSRYQIQLAQCSADGTARVFLVLNRPLEEPTFLSQSGPLVARNGEITLTPPSTSAEPFTQSCFGDDDLSVERDGRIRLKVAEGSEAKVMTLHNPPRIALFLTR